MTTKTTDTQPQTWWAAYVGTAHGNSISLHATYREALEVVASALWGDQPEADQYRPDMEDDELVEALDDHCSTSADDWHVQEVEAP